MTTVLNRKEENNRVGGLSSVRQWTWIIKRQPKEQLENMTYIELLPKATDPRTYLW